MSDFINKLKNTRNGASNKKANKEAKKAVTKALSETFKMAMTGQVAGIQHNSVQYVMMRHDVFNGIIKNGGQMLITDEQKRFHQEYQVLLHLMQNLNIEKEEESLLFDELDQFTFEFSQAMNDPNGQKKRSKIVKEFKDTIASDKTLVIMENNLRKQMMPQENKVENNGKLT